MKKLLFGLALIMGLTALGQNVKPSASYTSNASSAVMAYREKKLDNAKIYIDAALEQMLAKQKEGVAVKLKNEEKIYTTRGLVYFDLSNQQEDQAKIDFLEIATEMLKKEYEIGKKGTDNHNKATRTLKMISNKFYNLCGDHYGVKEYTAALNMAEKSIDVRNILGEQFLDAYFNAALSASMAEKHDMAVKYFDILIQDKEYGGEDTRPLLYSKKAYSQKQLGLSEESFETIKEGRIEFPADRDLFTAEVDYYLQTGQTEEAFKNLDKLIESDSGNSLYLALKGDLYGELANHEDDDSKRLSMYQNGINAYNKAIEINAEYLHAYFNAGVYFINIANIVNRERNELDYNEVEKDKELKTKEDENYQGAVKMFEACISIDSEDIAAYDALRKIYFNLGEEEKSNEMKVKIEEIKAKG